MKGLSSGDSALQKVRAAKEALTHVESNMLVGLGSGSTAHYAIEALGDLLERGELTDIAGVPTSEASGALARKRGIPLIDLPAGGVDVAIDGIDEITPELDAIKGLGGALTREKMVAASASMLILIGDASKAVDRLGMKAPIPVEILPFGWRRTQTDLEALGCRPRLRQVAEQTFLTDNGNYILDCFVSPPIDAVQLACALALQPGVVEHGLFLGMAQLAYIATAETVRTYRKGERR
ncbi:MAG: ribose-5-phosphate isomerase RpiA [Trueperaceae bacterium]|nr:MAG: ribose-5-phosphate isomerase RpiA [Trueperaceae bacterium]